MSVFEHIIDFLKGGNHARGAENSVSGGNGLER